MQKVDLVTRRFHGIIDQVRRHRLDLIGCSETRTVSARSVQQHWSIRVEATQFLCGLTSQKTHRRGPIGLGGSVHEEAHPCFPCFIQPSFKSIDAGSIYHPLVWLIPSINHSV